MRRARALPKAVALGCLAWLLGGLPARADTPIALFKSLRGNLNFTGTEETLRVKDNRQPCSLVKGNKGIKAALTGIPSGAKVLSAQLYWAGSGNSADYDVTFDGVAVSAPTARRYQAKVVANSTTYTYFSGAADVTDQVAKKGNAYYSFDDLSVSTGQPWCSVEGVVGGFSLVVLYSHPDEPFRMLNLYEGFQSFRNSSLNIQLSGFNVPNPLPASVTGRVGHVTWEGDVTLSQGGEDLLFNGVALTDSMNPQGNQFNSRSNVTGDAYSYGIDFDIYTLRAPTIKGGQSSASTTYQSGQDMVLLSAEIVAMPYAAIADLALSMSRGGELAVGTVSDYILTVSNGGVDAETGPVTVVDTLPAGLKLVKAGGANWTCAGSAGSGGSTVVTCTHAGAVAAGATMTPITISVEPTKAGSYTNTATVSGATGDNQLANNTATDSGSASGIAAGLGFAFTSEACADGQALVVRSDETGCHRFTGPVVAGTTSTAIYVTAILTVDGVPRASKMGATDTALKFDLRANCLPTSGVSAAYAGTTLDCKGGWVNDIGATLPGGQASVALPNASYFVYRDVGRVSLALRYQGAQAASVEFVSKPFDLRFQSVARSADGAPDYEGGADDLYAFAKAGEAFAMRVGALLADGSSWAPSFGKEAPAPDVRLDLFAVDLAATPRLPVDGREQAVRDAFEFDAAAPGFAAGDGAMTATARWYEAGVFAATPYLGDYLGAGGVGGPPAPAVLAADPAARLVAATRVIGRFYPDHFATTVVKTIDCPTAANCPLATADPATTPAFPVQGAVYANQPFSFKVNAFGLPRAGKAPLLSLYESAAARPLSVAAVASPAGSAAPAGGPLSYTPDPRQDGDPPLVSSNARYRLGTPYAPDSAATRSAVAAWIAPTAIYLRASQPDTRITGGSAGKPTFETITIDSRAPAGAVHEQGLTVLSGRLLVPNVFGSDLLRLPVNLSAQYWSGTGWATSDGDGASIVAASLQARSCLKAFAADGKAGACKAGVLAPAAPLPLQLAAGRARLILQAPVRGSVGSIDFSIDNGSEFGVPRDWLPSSIGRATFGLYRSPLIYLREMY